MAQLQVFALVFVAGLTMAAAAPTKDDHSIQKRQTTVNDEIARIFDGSPVSLVTVVGVLLVLLLIDVVLTYLFATVFSGRSRRDYSLPRVGEYISDMYNSIDVVDMALNYMAVEEEECKFKAVCMAEQAAVSNPIARLAINTINSNLSGLTKYSRAVEAGLRGEDCQLLYDKCVNHLQY